MLVNQDFDTRQKIQASFPGNKILKLSLKLQYLFLNARNSHVLNTNNDINKFQWSLSATHYIDIDNHQVFAFNKNMRSI